MERRDFIKTLPALSLTPLSLASMPTGEATNGKNLIALGTNAGRFVSQYHAKLSFDSFTIVDKQRLSCFDQSLSFLSFLPSEDAFRKIRDFDSSSPFLDEKLGFSEALLKHFRMLKGELIFLVGVGKSTGTLLAKMVMDSFGDSSPSIKILATSPFRFEGIKPEMRATAIAELYSKTGFGNSILSLENVAGLSYGENMQSLFEAADREILKRLKMI